jgi:HSP20 family molecular chaperone IbpA
VRLLNKKGNISHLDTLIEYLEELKMLTDKLMEFASPEGPSWNIETCCLHALSNIFITPKEVIITADLPNIEPETVKVEVINENLIEITAEMKEKMRFTDLGISHREGEFSFLWCQGRVQEPIDIEKMRISCEKGILEVRFPRKKLHKTG